ncbi:MAG: septum formation protein Maf [Bacteroidetes bacterium]|nr:MAG: septum formation protein Maf [Bacteroidota bacterium]TAG86503.1 MAG: septum formation protein Maf [Bacteroidota bacterium]
MNKKKILLASQSPRRQQLLKDANFIFESIKPIGEETYPAEMPVVDVPLFLARQKSYSIDFASDIILITADTVVILENEMIGKPTSEQDAKDMLGKLSGKMHTVVTGVYMRSNQNEIGFSTHTNVFFNHLTKENIDFYVEKYKPLDKAGSYGIQDWIGLIGVEKIEGCFYNVMGLPMSELYKHLSSIDF